MDAHRCVDIEGVAPQMGPVRWMLHSLRNFVDLAITFGGPLLNSTPYLGSALSYLAVAKSDAQPSTGICTNQPANHDVATYANEQQ